MYEKTQIYQLNDRTIGDFQKITEKTLKSLGFTTQSAKLDDTLSIVSFIDKSKDIDSQKDNKIAVYQEQDEIYIQIKGLFTEKQAEQFWQKFKENLMTPKKEKIKEDKDIFTKEKIIDLIKNKIKEKGQDVEEGEVKGFVENFEKEFERLPKKNELESIATGYVKMLEDTEPPEAEKVEIEEQEFQEDLEEVEAFQEEIDKEKEVSAKDALKFLIKDYDFLTEEEIEYFINLLDDYSFEDQKLIVSNIGRVEEKLSAISDLESEKVSTLRKELVLLTNEEIDEKIKQLIVESSVSEEPLIEGPEGRLKALGFLTDSNIATLFNMIKDLAEIRQDQVIERLKAIESEFRNLEDDGISLSDWERSQYRIELVKLTAKNRKERLLELVRDKKEELIREMLFEEVPQFKYEDNEKILKELLWLSKDEISQRIQNIKQNIKKQLDKKQELFSKSTAGGTCPECGWPVGSFTKKCPRCGRKLIDWL